MATERGHKAIKDEYSNLARLQHDNFHSSLRSIEFWASGSVLMRNWMSCKPHCSPLLQPRECLRGTTSACPNACNASQSFNCTSHVSFQILLFILLHISYIFSCSKSFWNKFTARRYIASTVKILSIPYPVHSRKDQYVLCCSHGRHCLSIWRR